jgi:Fe-S cluster assembly protein SufD
MDEKARGIFQGKVIVQRDAQKTDGKQSSHGLLLSEAAEFDAKPELEIYADDVVCGHGATSGDIDHNHLFYLRSRGIPDAEAKSMLIAAFVAEAFDTIGHEGVRDELTSFAETWLVIHKEATA